MLRQDHYNMQLYRDVYQQDVFLEYRLLFSMTVWLYHTVVVLHSTCQSFDLNDLILHNYLLMFFQVNIDRILKLLSDYPIEEVDVPYDAGLLAH